MCVHNLRRQFECQKWRHRVTMMAPGPNTIFQFQSVSGVCLYTRYRSQRRKHTRTHTQISRSSRVESGKYHMDYCCMYDVKANQFGRNITNEISFHRMNSMPSFLTCSSLSLSPSTLKRKKQHWLLCGSLGVLCKYSTFDKFHFIGWEKRGEKINAKIDSGEAHVMSMRASDGTHAIWPFFSRTF